MIGMQVVRIPEERKAVLVGKGFKTKREIENITKTKIKINDVVMIDGEAVGEIIAKNIVAAISRGFSPERAYGLSEEGRILEIIDLSDWFSKPERIKMQKGRIIGTGGKTRKKIEDLTGTHVSVYGNTISIIGTWKQARKAKDAIGRLLQGKSHSFVYKQLER